MKMHHNQHVKKFEYISAMVLKELERMRRGLQRLILKLYKTYFQSCEHNALQCGNSSSDSW
jgi:hypothetical protein